MKKINRILSTTALLLAGVFAMNSCVEQAEVPTGDPYFYIEDGKGGELSSLEVNCLENTKGADFIVRSNRDWNFIPVETYDWIRIYPEDGGKGDGKMFVVYHANQSTQPRSAQFSIFVGGEEQPSLFIVSQEKDTPRIAPAKEKLTVGKSAGSHSLKVVSNIEWTATASCDWLTIAEVTSDAVKFNVIENASYDQRSCEISLAGKGEMAEVTAAVKVTQEAMGADLAGLTVEWLFSSETLSAYKESWTDAAGEATTKAEGTNDRYASANLKGVGKLEYWSIDKSEIDSGNKFYRTVGSTGHPFVYGPWIGDYFLFSVPTVNIPAGTIIQFSWITRVSATGPKYWMLEVYDGDEWVPAFGEVATTSDTAEPVEYNMTMFPDGSTNVTVNEKYTYKKNTDIGKIMIRQRVVSMMQASGAGELSKPNGGTARIAGAEDTSPKISVLYVGNGVVGDVPATSFEIEGVDDDTILFEAAPSLADTVAFTMKVSTDWSISSSAKWVKVSPKEGVADELTEIKVIADTNTTASIRKAVLTITGGPDEKKIVVVQAPPSSELEPFVSVVGGNSMEVASEAGVLDVEVQTNVDFDVEISEPWIRALPVTKAAVEKVPVQFTVAENEGSEERSATIRFYNAEHNVESVLTVVQAAAFTGYADGDLIYYETVGVVSGNTALASVPWNPTGPGAASVVYTGGSKVDARKTCNQGSSTNNGSYTTYDVTLLPGVAASNLGNVYFGNDTAEGCPNSYFQINNITIAGAEALRFGFGFYCDIANYNGEKLIVSYKFDTASDWTVLEEMVGEKNWYYRTLKDFAVPEGATSVSIKFQATVKQMFRIDDFTLVAASLK